MPFEIRPATPADAASLWEIDRLVSKRPWGAGQFDAACAGLSANGAARAGQVALVLVVKARACGFIVFSRVLDEASIENIAVHPSQQGRGFGHSLLRAALERMRLRGLNRCLLEVRESNAAARALYEQCQFQLDGVRKNYYPSFQGREDALLMSRPL